MTQQQQSYIRDEHRARRYRYNDPATSPHSKSIDFGYLLGLEAACSCAGELSLSRELAELRQKECPL